MEILTKRYLSLLVCITNHKKKQINFLNYIWLTTLSFREIFPSSRDILSQFLFFQSDFFLESAREGSSYRDRIAINNRNEIFVSQLQVRSPIISSTLLINQRVNGAKEQKRNIYVAKYICRDSFRPQSIFSIPRFQRVNNFCPETFPPREIRETYICTSVDLEPSTVSTLIREWPLSRLFTSRAGSHYPATSKNKKSLFVYSKIIIYVVIIEYSRFVEKIFFQKYCTIYSDYTLRSGGLFIFTLIPILAYLTNEIEIPSYSKYLDNCYRNYHNSSRFLQYLAYYFMYNKVARNDLRKILQVFHL